MATLENVRANHQALNFRIISGILLVFTLALLIGLIALASQPGPAQDEAFNRKSSRIRPRDPSNPTVFEELSKDELIAVRNYLLYNTSLRLTEWEDATPTSSYIYMIELHRPPKARVLCYYDGDKRPERKAKVVVFRGDRANPTLVEYIVAPLPEPTMHLSYINPSYLKYPLPYSSKPRDTVELRAVDAIVRNATAKMYHILKRSYGYTYHNCTDRCLAYTDGYSSARKSGERKSWLRFMRKVEGTVLNPVGFQLLVNKNNPDHTKWIIEKVYYHHQRFDSVEEFVARYDNCTIDKARLPEPVYEKYSGYQKSERQPNMEVKPGPHIFQRYEPRFSVNGRHVRYMEWSFHFSLNTGLGYQLFDVTFKNQRIAYELGPRETAALHSGYNPMHSSAIYSSGSVALHTFELMEGVDCPDGAVFFDSHVYIDTGKPLYLRRAACLFEWNTGRPLRRHYDSDFSGGYTFAGGLKDEVLVFRSIGNIHSHDYLFDYVFHNDGVIEVSNALTGYMRATAFHKHELKHGFQIQENVVASLSNHFWNYKVDLDVVGVKNRFSTYDVKLETVNDPWDPSMKSRQKILKRTKRQSEKKALIKYDFDHPKAFLFYNQNVTNKFGNHRSYRILPTHMSKMLYPEKAALTKGMAFAKYQLAVTKQKDNEVSGSSIYSQSDPFDPVVSFDNLVSDDESLIDVDLVAWVTLGMLHIPRTEDIPTVTTSTTTASFFIVPFNYYTEDPSMSNPDHVIIKPTENFQDFVVYGQTKTEPTCPVQRIKKPFQYNGTVFQ